MADQALQNSITIAEVFSQVWNNGSLTQTDRQLLRSTLLTGSLSEDEQTAIDRLLYAVRRGWLQIVD